MVDKLLRELGINLEASKIAEFRLRRNLPIKYLEDGVYKKYRRGGTEVIATKELIERAIAFVTDNSYYAFEESFASGFIGFFGAKISLGGRCVVENGKLSSIRDVSSMNVRIPKIVDCVEREFSDEVFSLGQSVIIAGKVCSGKTTFLRALTAKCDRPVTVVDEKGELNLFDGALGENADVLSFLPKEKALELAVKGLSPEYIAFDEVVDFSVVEKARHAGLKVLATTFGEEGCLRDEKTASLFQRAVFLSASEKGFCKSIIS